MDPLKICIVSSEVAPFAKTGGLADVAGALARFLGRAGHDVRVVMPLYRRIRAGDWTIEPEEAMRGIEIEFGEQELTFSVLSTTLPNSEVSVYLVDCPELYDREEIYTAGDEDAVRFALLSRASLEACQRMQWAADVFHVNDWHAALLPLYLKTTYAWDRLFLASKTLLTIH
ncbi:MAG: glycogen/starch synthase, partial [Planctomycetota bacterium]|nr:glycogen/starch synthase [Planctomycetota bacterium]